MVCSVTHARPTLAPQLALYGIARRNERRIADDDVETAAVCREDVGEIESPGKIKGTIEIRAFELAELGIKLIVEWPVP